MIRLTLEEGIHTPWALIMGRPVPCSWLGLA